MMIRPGMFMEDRYEILDKIGSGGMSDVYKAKDHKLNRFVAIKFLKQEYCEDKNFVSKFQIEAQSAAALLHPNVVSVYDVNEADGIYYIVMEYVDGITLKRYIDRNGRLPIKEATSIAIQVGQGIEAAHNANIIHRDIKPQNVLVFREGKIKVTDFGIARTTTANTISQDILGSVHYISPEQARGGQVDERSDIYSFGIVFYEMVTGELPFDGDSTVTIALKHIQESVPLVSDIVPGIPSSVVRIIEKCTQKKPERRYQKMSSLLADLKTSLISPNEDFVVLEPETQENATILMTDADARVLRSGAESSGHHREDFEEYENEYDGEYDDEYEEYESEYDPYDDDYEEYEDDYKEKKGPRKKFDKVLLICGIVAGVIVLIVLAVVVTRTISSGSGGCGGKKAEEKMTVEMVDVVGKNVQEAKKTLEDAGLSVELKYEPSNDVPEECVISQSVSAGTRVDSQSKITLTVSSGQSTIKLSNYTNKTQKEAEDDLKKLGISTKVTNQYDENIETGKVIKTNPAAGSDISKSTVVELIVSRGKETKTVNMPDLVGFTKEDATGILTQDKLTYDITTQETDKEQVGKVISQSIAAETPVEEGTLVVLTIGVEPQVVLVTVPSLIGYTQDEAVSMLKNAGLEVGSVTTEEGDPGIVVAQGVDAGSSVAQGTAIAIVVGEHHEPEPEPQTETNANTDELE